MRDSELAASLVDGDPGALAETYDRYADLLWSYSRSLLNDDRQAAEAVADTFVIASSRLEVLPAFGRLRAWLYAVARAECLRRMGRGKDAETPGGAERLRRAAAVLSTGEQQQLRALLSEGFTGLDDDERDVMQMVWHGLDLAEVGAIRGISRSEAYALFTRARDQLESTVGVLLMGWSGRGGCDEFEETLYGRDSKLTPELRSRLSKHIARCDTCQESYQRQMRPSLLMALSVGALLSEGAAARAAAGHAPPALWEQVYQMTSAASPESRWHKILGGRRVTFGPDGFPRQLSSGREGLAAPVKVAAVGAVAVAATATGWATHGHFAASSGTSAAKASQEVAPVAPQTRAAAAETKGAHAGQPSTKTVSHHKPAHAKPQPAGSSPSALPSTTTSGGTSVPVSSGSSSSGSAGSYAGTTASSGSTPASSGSSASTGSSASSGSSSTTSSGSAGSGSTGTSSSGSGSSSGSSGGGSSSGSGSGSGSSGSSGGVVGTVVGTVGSTVGTVTGTVGGVLGGL